MANLSKKENYSQKDKDRLKNQASRYLTKSEMLVHFPPDYRELKVNEKYILNDMKAGQETPYLRQPMGAPGIRFVTSFHTGVKAILRDGREYDLAKKYRLPDGDYDFKLVAYEDGARGMVMFKKK